MSVLKFPTKPQNIRGKSQICWWLREIADLIESESLEVQPEAIALLLVDKDKSEFLHVGGIRRKELKNELIKSINKLQYEKDS
ncbi:hypothetical protein NDJ00_07220 [Vibrio parahaemolyticus]|uniref:hypothetical protein n=1 Tax=Vibrio TaxID=662 RepID=UPI000B8FEFE8|nr:MULTISPECIES: hypothetical protein [Vibrio]MCS0113972.1 hypothetical protein [Vibrio parahaemolyticus]OXX64656.1 hypothetical protein B9J89_01870 [Vibrio sp. V15_P4S5T153]